MRQSGCETYTASRAGETAITSPYRSFWCQLCRCQKMSVNIPYAESKQPISLDKFSYLFISRNIHLRKIKQDRYLRFPAPQVSERHFPDYERVGQDFALV